MQKTIVQSVTFKRPEWTEKKAEIFLKKNNFKKSYKGKKVDITPNQLRYRQKSPSLFSRFRTKILTGDSKGVNLIFGFR